MTDKMHQDLTWFRPLLTPTDDQVVQRLEMDMLSAEGDLNEAWEMARQIEAIRQALTPEYRRLDTRRRK